MLVTLTLTLGVAAFFTFRWCDITARERGLIDRTTGYLEP